MLVIRLTRVGKKKQPSYRVIVQEKGRDPWGKAKDIVGFYNPRSNPKLVQFKEERVKQWLAKGAQASPAVHNLLVNAKIVAGAKAKASSNRKKEEKK